MIIKFCSLGSRIKIFLGDIFTPVTLSLFSHIITPFVIDLIGTKQYGDSYFTLTEYEIESIELDPDKEDLRKSE